MSGMYNILVAGVGGQGNIICSRVLAQAAKLQGKRPIIGETFGASRRGGTVFTHVRIGDQDYGALIPRGHLNLLLGLEPLEGLRAAIKFAGEDTYAIISSTIIQTASTLSGQEQYPKLENIVSALSSICKETYLIDFSQVFADLGTSRILNMYVLGALAGSNKTPLKTENIMKAIGLVVSSNLPNEEAFQKGLRDIQNCEPIKSSL
jgi:indolepyruvate ferredoxin oxidoreductase beta subunit